MSGPTYVLQFDRGFDLLEIEQLPGTKRPPNAPILGLPYLLHLYASLPPLQVGLESDMRYYFSTFSMKRLTRGGGHQSRCGRLWGKTPFWYGARLVWRDRIGRQRQVTTSD